jgi:uncharacterized protein (TIGR02466 family)
MYEHPEMESINKEITDILVAESLSVPSLTHSNVGGWHSKYDLQLRPESCFRKLSEMVIRRAQETNEAIARTTGQRLAQLTPQVHMWAMVMREGDYTIPHTHADCHWASVYYPDVGDANETTHPDSGVIAFIDPRSGFLPIPGLDLTGGNFVVNAKVGQMLVFPGWLSHYVHAYRGQRPRVSVACNVTYQKASSSSGNQGAATGK